MSFDAGAITGSLKLDISEYAEGIIESEALMRAFPPLVVEFLENPLIGLIAVAKEAGASLLDMAGEVMNAANEIGLAAQKSGTSVEYFSQLSWAAKEVNVSAEQLGVGMRMLQMRAAEAVTSGGEAAKQFERFGISQQFLAANLNNSEALFRKMTETMDRLPSSAEKNDAAMRLMGRSGAELIPLLAMGSQKIDEMGQKAAEFGALETGESARAGAAWRQMSVEVEMAWEGIKKALGEAVAPKLIEEANQVLHWVQQHGPEIRQTVEKVADDAKEAIDALGPSLMFLLEHIDVVLGVLGAGGLGYVAASAVKSLAAIGVELVALTAKLIAATVAEEGFAAASAQAAAAGKGMRFGGAATLAGAAGAAAGYSNEYGTGTPGGAMAGSLGAAAGWEAGSTMGATVGTFFMPGIGTAIGYFGGGLIGAAGGYALGTGSVGVYHYIKGDVKVQPGEDSSKAVSHAVGEQVKESVQKQYAPVRSELDRRQAYANKQMVARAMGGLSR